MLVPTTFLPHGSDPMRDLEELETLLADKVLDDLCSDNFDWSHEDFVVFSISSCYALLFQVKHQSIIVD